MTLLNELKIFIKHIASWIIFFVVFSLFFFLFGIEKIEIFGQNYYLPVPSENSFSVLVFNQIGQDLLPSGVQLLATDPISAFLAQISISMLLSFLITTPLFIYKIILYLRPALFPHERRAVLLSILPLTVLFVAGAAFSYFFLIPVTFKVLYPYAINVGAVPFFSISEFIRYVVGLMIAIGIMFLLPLFMALLSFVGIIKAEFWKKNWQYSCLLFLISSAIITPDGTGITMMMLFIPLAALYFAGYVFAGKLDGRV